MQAAQRRQPRLGAGESRSGNSAVGRPESGPDLNWERMVFYLTSQIGHKVTAKLRNNIVYEGIFHSCAVEGDQSITLKSARRVEAGRASGDTIPTLIISGKDFLQVSALDVPPSPDGTSESRRGFATDAEITGSRADRIQGRDLVPWADFSGSSKGDKALEEEPNDGPWDQFRANEQLHGVTSNTFREELYTTKLDPSQISEEKRAKADAIARAIESGTSFAEVEGRVESRHDDEEGRFAAASTRRSVSKPLELPSVPDSDRGDDLQVRKARGMMSEMKRINALNLEPTMPKIDDGPGKSRMNFKDSNPRSGKAAGPESKDTGVKDTKQELQSLKATFQQSLDNIRRQEAKRQQQSSADGGDAGRSPTDGADMKSVNSKGFSFNPQAKAFSLNPKAGEFTPSHSNSQGGAGSGPAAGSTSGHSATQPASSSLVPKPVANSPPFVVKDRNPEQLRKALVDLLDPFYHLARGRAPDSESREWREAKGPRYREVLGQPNPGSRPTFPLPVGPGMSSGGPCRGGPGAIQGGACQGSQGCSGSGPCQGGPGGCHGAPGQMQAAASGCTGSGAGCSGSGGATQSGGWQQAGASSEQSSGSGPAGGCGTCTAGSGSCGGCCGGCSGGCCAGACGTCGGGCCPGGCCGGCTGSGQQPMMFMTSTGGMQGQMYPQMYAVPSGPGGGSTAQGSTQGSGTGPQQGQTMMMGQQMMGQQGWTMPKFPGPGPQGGQMMMMPVMVGPNGPYMQPGFMPQQAMQGQSGQPGMGTAAVAGSQMDGGQPMMQQGIGFNKRGGNG